MPGAQGDQKRELDTLELALEIFATIWSLGNKSRVSKRTASTLNNGVLSPAA